MPAEQQCKCEAKAVNSVAKKASLDYDLVIYEQEYQTKLTMYLSRLVTGDIMQYRVSHDVYSISYKKSKES